MSIFGFLIAAFGLGLIIFVHELGHFLSGKLLRLKVTEFFLGLPIGRAIFSFRRGETVYGVKPVLFGGYVKFPEFMGFSETKVEKIMPKSPAERCGLKKEDKLLKIDGVSVDSWIDILQAIDERAGQTVSLDVVRADEQLELTAEIGTREGRGWLGAGPAATDKITIEDLPETLEGQGLWRKSVVVAAGPVMNIVLAVLLFAGALMIGFAKPTTTIGKVIPGGPAEEVGLKSGDKLVSVAGDKSSDWGQVIKSIEDHAGEPVIVVVKRDNRRMTFTPVLRKKSKEGRLGISTKLVRQPEGPVVAFRESFSFVYQATGIILSFMGKLVTEPGSVLGQLRSPIGVVQETAPIAQRDFLEYLVTLAGISIAIGIFNFLPLPPLDGGRIFISGIEFIIRRRLPKESLIAINVVGVSLLLVLMTYVIAADLFRIANPGGG